MSYELDRMQKERRALFEAEMQRRMQYLDAINELNNWSYYFMHLHSNQCVDKGVTSGRTLPDIGTSTHSHSLEAKT